MLIKNFLYICKSRNCFYKRNNSIHGIKRLLSSKKSCSVGSMKISLYFWKHSKKKNISRWWLCCHPTLSNHSVGLVVISSQLWNFHMRLTISSQRLLGFCNWRPNVWMVWIEGFVYVSFIACFGLECTFIKYCAVNVGLSIVYSFRNFILRLLCASE